MNANHREKILVTGATGYIGGRLVPALLERGYPVRVLVRNKNRLLGRNWYERVEIFEGDVLVKESIQGALAGVRSAYYLIHSMAGGDDFHHQDLIAAENFSTAAREAELDQIIYLGGLGDYSEDLSKHLKSRHDTGKALSIGGVPVTELRAAVIVGSGSVSFEMIRYLTERVPLMVCPRWVYTRTQPIGIDDVLSYLIAALGNEESKGKVVEIGGSEIITYGKMMMGYAHVRGLKRVMIPIPFLTPKLSAYWVHWVTPVSAEIAHSLVEGLRNEAVVRNDDAKRYFPGIKPKSYLETVQSALTSLDAKNVESRWTDSLTSSQGISQPVVLTTQEGMILEVREKLTEADRSQLFQVLEGLGGDTGWLYMNWAWEIRGLIDRFFGGVGLRRGRRNPTVVRIGDALDFWRVEDVSPASYLLLRSEMITPGDAWLEYTLADQEGLTRIKQTAYFAPKGLAGFLYWYLLYPIHSIIFSGLIRAIIQKAEAIDLGQIREVADGESG